MINTIRIHTDDNVIIALEDATAGTEIQDPIAGEFKTVTAVPMFHKIAVADIPEGHPVVKYGSPIGVATQDIAKGAHVHVHNVDSAGKMLEETGGAQ